MESSVTLLLIGTKCIKNRLEKFENYQQFFKKEGGGISHPSFGLADPPYDLPRDLRVCHGKFGDAGYYRD
jgi:hypothetical protein